MRQRRVKDGNTIVFDARDVLDGRGKKDRVLLEMRNGPISYTTEEGVKFWRKHPFQWVSKDEAELLKNNKNPEFREVDKADVEDYYAID